MSYVDITRPTQSLEKFNEMQIAKAFKQTFLLWPDLWAKHVEASPMDWHSVRLNKAAAKEIPECPGIYTLLVEPRLYGHPECSYLMYVGQAEHLRKRFREYLAKERRETGRPLIYELLNAYTNNLWFCYTTVDIDQLNSVEDTLIAAHMPPKNDRVPAEVLHIMKAFK